MNRQSFALIVAEKPSVAAAVASVIIRDFQKRKGFLEGEGYLISWCLGHLAEPAQPEVYRDEWRKWSLDSLPILPDKWTYVIKESTKEQFHVLSKLMNREDVSEVICATDVG